MDLVSKSYTNTIRVSQQALPPVTTSGNSILGFRSHSSDTSFPIIAIAVIGILATGFLLVSYYVFVIKCCLNWHRIDLPRRFSLSRRRPEDASTAYFPALEHRGLEESVIRLIPIFQFKKNNGDDYGDGGSLCECAVCLNEFREDEKLRRIPNCRHVFHIDCIDVWLQSNANCPLCRTSISSNTINGNAPSSAPQDPSSAINGDEDYVVIELDNNNNHNNTSSMSNGPSPVKKEARKLQKGTSMGDEWIDSRDKSEEFAAIQPIRRSISMDSSADQQLYLAVQEAIRQKRQVNEVSPIEGCSSSSRVVRRSFFSFGHGRGSKTAVLPLHLEP
ncbi:hypothetical protein HRI_003866000 [Hibiscus trionum]|uniref:RING-type E3 ubiquitin transferase n=1 Tax=Hibiscus trionum TaxID=183268 RepID=A0A9W7ISS6_HIBTR|nr:hypothetical protein HRI_003866000 [Hibiscus trionum]